MSVLSYPHEPERATTARLLGVIMPYKLEEARTLRKRVLSRLIFSATAWGFHITTSLNYRQHIEHKFVLRRAAYEVPAEPPTLEEIYEVCLHGEGWQMQSWPLNAPSVLVPIKEGLSKLPFKTYKNSNPHAAEWLQDLADIIAWEGGMALTAEEYSGIPDICIEPGHVLKVMEWMQTKLEKERIRQNNLKGDVGLPFWPQLLYTEMPPERQRALAERRRYWMGRFGITPETWPTGFFSLWDVAEDPLPECLK